MSRDRPKEKERISIVDIICMICVIIMTAVAVLVAIYIVSPEKAYVQEWTSPAGTTYYISNMHMQVVPDENKEERN